MIFKLSLLSLVVVVTACSDLTAQLAKRRSLARDRGGLGIYHGRNTPIQKHNFMVSIVACSSVFGSGTIINKNWVVTCGECLDSLSPNTVSVVAGSEDGYTGSSYNVISFLSHPKMNYTGSNNYDYDYGLLQIDGQFEWSAKIRPAKLPRKVPKVNTTLMVTGYGAYNESDYQSGPLRKATMKWVSPQTCEDYYNTTLTPRMGCVYNKGKRTLCLFDCGDPFVKGRVLHATFGCVTSANTCNNSTGPLTVASILPAVDWIREVTGVK